MSLKDAAMLAVNQRLIMQGVDWNLYERVLEEYRGSNAVHFAYDDGFLEVEVPLAKHEIPSRKLSDLVMIACDELGLDAVNAGSTTFRLRSKAKGVEPDTCFYIQNELKIRGKLEIDLQTDPPPDLVVEVDISSPSLNKLSIYAALGVPEVWLYKGERVEIYKLYGEFYKNALHSSVLPMFSERVLTDFLHRGLTEGSSNWIREIREWLKKK